MVLIYIIHLYIKKVMVINLFNNPLVIEKELSFIVIDIKNIKEY